MTYSLDLWLEYIIRFSHLVAGIAWIGSSLHFIWLDSSFLPPESPRRNVDGELYMVHGGYYYQVEKRKIYPGELPKILHWFKWEATLTWLTGFALLIVLYYFKGASLLIDPSVRSLTQLEAVGLSLGLIFGSWAVYDFIWNKKFISSSAVSTILSAIFFTGLIYLYTQIFSGRGAFIQTGATFGTLMLINVWMRILPGQKKMLADAEAGKVPDYSIGLKSKVRSVHNTYFTFPVLFIMISNHYGSIYNHQYNWILLILLSITGALVRHAMVTNRPIERWTLLPASIGLGALIWMTAANTSNANPSGSNSFLPINDETVMQIMQMRCVSCHSSNPTDDIFKVPPKDVRLETMEQINNQAQQIFQLTTVSRIMPLGNKTQMTEGERQVIRDWYIEKFDQ